MCFIVKKLVKSNTICDKIYVGFLPAMPWKETVCGGMAVHRKQQTAYFTAKQATCVPTGPYARQNA